MKKKGWKDVVKKLVPPIFMDAFGWGKRKIKRFGYIESEYVPEGWEYSKKESAVKGWNETSILDVYKKEWPLFEEMAVGKGPLYTNPSFQWNSHMAVESHNILACFKYAIALACSGREKVSFLDWGGGIGFYYLFAKAALPGVKVNYCCKDMPIFVEYGKKNLPECEFLSDDSWCGRTFDLVMASSSIQYAVDWKTLLTRLAGSAERYLYIAQIPVIKENPSFVFIQRPYLYGYRTEYLAWCLNKNEFVEYATGCGLALVREFDQAYRPVIHGAPEQNEYRGFLFEKIAKGN